MGPRPCIFTNKRSKHKLVITEDKHSWAKAVPCSKAYLICRENRFYRTRLLALEPDLIHYFFDYELDHALGVHDRPYEDGYMVKIIQAKIHEIIGHEVERYERLDDRSFEKALEAMMKTRLDSLFSAD